MLSKAGKMGRERKEPTPEAPEQKETAGAGLDVKRKERTESQLIPKSQTTHLAINREDFEPRFI